MVNYSYTRLPVPATHAQSPQDNYRTTLRSQICRRPKTFVVFFLSAFIVLAFVASVNEGQHGISSEALSPIEAWEYLYQQSRQGWRPLPARRSAAHASLSYPGPLSIDRFSSKCLDQWVAKGELCNEMEWGFTKHSVAVLYTYVNGSDLLMTGFREGVARNIRLGRTERRKRAVGGRLGLAGGNTRSRKPRPMLEAKKKHYRDHDELRYSLRSLLTAFNPSSISKIHLLTADLPLYALPDNLHPILPNLNATISFAPDANRLGQVPSWLEQGSSRTFEPPLELALQSEVFLGSHAVVEKSVPSFSSLAIESRMVNIDGLAEFVLYMNDDVFLMNPLTATDVASPLLGPVFRLQQDLLVSGTKPSDEMRDPDGEWPGLSHANWLLDQRFGERKRHYLAHIAKTFSTPLLREAQELWLDEFAETAQSRFRGLTSEFQTLFLATHYVIERHREALLWSYFVGRSDSDQDGFLSMSERKAMLEGLGFPLDTPFRPSSEIIVQYPRRRSLATLQEVYRSTGLELPKSTEIVFDSRDGYVSFSPPVPRYFVNRDDPMPFPVYHAHTAEEETRKRDACAFIVKECMGDDFLKERKEIRSDDIFKRVAFEDVRCGDCAILALLGRSGDRGLSAFLPPGSGEEGDGEEITSAASAVAPLGGKATIFEQFETPADLKGDLRQHAVRRIQRYSYTVGTSYSRLVPISQYQLALATLANISPGMAKQHNRKQPPPPPTFLTLNDQTMSDKGSELVNTVLTEFFVNEWPKPSVYER